MTTEISRLKRFIGRGLFTLSAITRRTGRFQVEGMSHFTESRRQGPVILTAWHGMTMMLAGYLLNHYETDRLALILPDDWRGETLSVWAEKQGALPYPMNLKGEAGMATARRLAGLVRLVKREGYDCYINPDGPDGPAYRVKPGAVYIAQKTGAALLPLGAYTRTAYRLNRWDQYAVPYPWSRISVVIGPPLTVAGELTTVAGRLTDALHRAAAQAAANYYEKRSV